MCDLSKIYHRRFRDDIPFRNRMYRVLCQDFLQRYIPPGAVVLDLASGYCEFINNIRAGTKIALDLNPEVTSFAAEDVRVVVSSAMDMAVVASNSVDVVFTSNFFEHLPKPDIVRTIHEVHRILKPNGRFLILQPNIRYCGKDYWMFFDHITPLDDRSLCEVLEVNGFTVTECRPKFLPYTTKSRLPKSVFLLQVYLRIPAVHRIFGKQAFLCAEKASAG